MHTRSYTENFATEYVFKHSPLSIINAEIKGWGVEKNLPLFTLGLALPPWESETFFVLLFAK